ncbi:SGNH/GDSL hydrolase family protein [Ferruginibacter paludis]|uniref:SGNH/GDSL hydrolase family protein n=1 Tax=Ferruginibacter paludis TaxID=1310417 RepID=UPI0025B39B20|nr:SGNH/GDSL hydrolase family protein [Ferruginibacter paludis]MDN3655547.1 SGNH/GDSL hydrolase family protein [Ferruginibacter paludis]
MKKLNAIIVWCCLSLVYTMATAQVINKTTRKILFIGNSITWAGMYVNDVEAYLRVQYPGRHFEIINVGLPSETVSGLSEPGHADGKFPRPDLHERLHRVLQQTKPDLVFACYGMNDGIYMPLDSVRFQKFKEGINWLHDEVVKAGARIVHLTPPDYDEVKGKSIGYTKVLDTYSDWLLSKIHSSRWQVIDIHYPMKKYLEEHRKLDANFALAQDGVHPDETGHWIMAQQILLFLGFKTVASSVSITTSLQQSGDAKKLLALVAERQNMLRDAWLTATKHTRPGMATGLPLREAQAKAASMLSAVEVLIPGKK